MKNSSEFRIEIQVAQNENATSSENMFFYRLKLLLMKTSLV